VSDTKKLKNEEIKVRRRQLTERLQSLRERSRVLEMELGEITKEHYRVVIFGSARIKPAEDIYELTYKLAALLGEKGIDVLTGGGPGLMEAANRGVLDGRVKAKSKSKSFGISIELNVFEPPSEHLDIKHHHKKFSSRLDDFMRLSNAVVVTPGGIGTLLELFFSWQLLQVGHMSDRPIVLLKRDFWHGIIEWMEKEQVGRNLVSAGDMRWIHIVDTPQEAMEIISPDHAKFLESLDKGLPYPRPRSS